DIKSVTITTHFGGGIGGDNWNIRQVALVVSFRAGSKIEAPTPTIVRDWLNASGAPLVRFTGDRHDHSEPVGVQDVGKDIRALSLVISTGNDDLRGGSDSGDNCRVAVFLVLGKTIPLTNVNAGHTWKDW